MIGSWIHFADQFHDIHEDGMLVSYIFVNGLPESRLFKITFPESRFVKSPNPESRSKLQSRISLPFFSKIPNPGLQISQIPDPKKPIGDPQICEHDWFSNHCSYLAVRMQSCIQCSLNGSNKLSDLFPFFPMSKR